MPISQDNSKSHKQQQSDQTAKDQRGKGDFELVASQHLPVPQDRNWIKKHPANRVSDYQS